jgi:3-dehydroquinate dehydratase / shikimate dehydrogenase
MDAPLLCDVVTAPTMAELRARRDAVERADLVELRLDTVDRPDVAGALQGRRRPVIVTCRAAWEGGHFRGSEEERQRILRDALEAGAEYVDIEWRAEGVDRWLRPADRPRVVLSLHDFERMPDGLVDAVSDMRRTGAGVVKVAGRAAALRDLLPLLDIGRAARRAGERTVLIGMGMCGLPSRILAAHFGSAWTYAGPAVAPGQVEAGRLLHEFRFRSIAPATRVYAVVGRPIAHSISPAMHNAAFAAAGIDAVYVPCEAADFDDFLALADALPIDGASVTAPFKLDAYQRSRPMDDESRQVGASNTLRQVPAPFGASDAGGASRANWESRNTDVAGFLAPLDRAIALRGAHAAILGTGGAARAVAVGLGAAGARVTVHARNTSAGADVAARASGDVREWRGDTPSQWDLLVNTTPIGTYPDVAETPCPGLAASLAASGHDGNGKGKVVYDLVYNPRPTRLLREAAAAGCATLDGLDMLVEQAARQFAWWTGHTPGVTLMRTAAERRLTEIAAEEPTAERGGELWTKPSTNPLRA